MKVLVVGSGGREHALAWKLAQSKLVEAVFVAPGKFTVNCGISAITLTFFFFFAGNGGTASGLEKVSNVDIDVGKFQELVDFAVKNGIDLVVPGPEAPLVDGIEGYFRKGRRDSAEQIPSCRPVRLTIYSRHPMLRTFEGSRPHGGLEGLLQRLHAPP